MDIKYKSEKMTLSDKTEITFEQAAEAFDEAIELMVRRLPGFATSGAAMAAAKITHELLHWMYNPAGHERPADLMREVLDETERTLPTFNLASKSGKEIIQ